MQGRQRAPLTRHFHSILHRDLKPSNIFIDVKGDVRIGDFGLAVNQGGADGTGDVFLSADNTLDDSDLTSGVGTSLYIAPETMSRARAAAAKHYSKKVDVYAFGIIVFELWHPFKTGMERIHVLHDLRRPEIKFPSTWDRALLPQQTRVVQACLTHDPELRPSPQDLLSSDMLPPRVGDDSIAETIRLLSHSGTTHAQKLITALFAQSDEDRLRKDFSYDFYDGSGVSAFETRACRCNAHVLVDYTGESRQRSLRPARLRQAQPDLPSERRRQG